MAAPTTTELLWGTAQRPKRGPKPTLSLERIVGEAIALADAEGLANLSMARLAERLGCAKMALYRYVPGKAELTALMLDAAMGMPPTAAHDADAPETWRGYLRLWAETLFDRILAHPWVNELAVGVHVMGPHEMEWLESALATLADTGLNASERFDTVVLLIGHVRSLIQQAGSDGGDAEARLQREMSAILTAHGERYPQVAAALTEAAGAPAGAGGRDNALHFGIDRILDGLGTLINQRE
ncbi:TetR/AcrR family transcriptional regulator [Nocardia sp. NPDC050406]|uniref:TetR/AcrR family transcriptional regulator n=1 Tax=Nocardia sp. NPDC050406 TaxID=3364318 RepID=UPI0037AA69BE